MTMRQQKSTRKFHFPKRCIYLGKYLLCFAEDHKLFSIPKKELFISKN